MGGLVAVSSFRRAWVSDDGGASWRTLGPAPLVRDDEGTEPVADESSGVRMLEASGEQLLAEVPTFYNYDHYLSHLAWSDDGGATWQPSDLGVGCRGPEATSELGGPVRIGSRLVATWSCTASDDQGGHLLVSTDEGRTWSDELPAPLDTRLIAPVLLDGHGVVSLGARNEHVEQSVDVVVRLTVEG